MMFVLSIQEKAGLARRGRKGAFYARTKMMLNAGTKVLSKIVRVPYDDDKGSEVRSHMWLCAPQLPVFLSLGCDLW